MPPTTNDDATVERFSSERTAEGGERTTVVIYDPTPAGDVHPSTPVVPADNTNATPVPAGELAADVVVVSPPSETTPTNTPPPDVVPDTIDGAAPAAPVATGATDDVTPSGHPADTPTFPAGDAGNAIVVRPDDPDATPVPAGDLDPATPVIAADTEPADLGPVTAVELAAAFDGEVPDAQRALDALDAAGFRVVRK